MTTTFAWDEAVMDRFWAKVQGDGRADGCWLWRAWRSPLGYGRFYVSREAPSVMAHRFAYVVMRADIPSGLAIDHLCRVPSCVNPWHLEPVTWRENTIRGESAAATHEHYAAQEECKYGHPRRGDNVRITPKGYRVCRVCQREWASAHYHLRKDRPQGRAHAALIAQLDRYDAALAEDGAA